MKSAPFSEPRVWAECEECTECHGRDLVRRFRQTDEEALASCPKCGQPPRCETGQSTEHRCPRPATGTYGGSLLCGQHMRTYDLSFEVEEW